MAAKEFLFNLRERPSAVAQGEDGQTGCAPGRERGNGGWIRAPQVFSGDEHSLECGMGKANGLGPGAVRFPYVDNPGDGDLNREQVHADGDGITCLDRNRTVEGEKNVAPVDALVAQRRIGHGDGWGKPGDEPAPQPMQNSCSGNRHRAFKVQRVGPGDAGVDGARLHRCPQQVVSVKFDRIAGV